MNIIIRARLDSTTLELPELAPLLGQRVEIVVSEDHTIPSRPFSSATTSASELLAEAITESGALGRLA